MNATSPAIFCGAYSHHAESANFAENRIAREADGAGLNQACLGVAISRRVISGRIRLSLAWKGREIAEWPHASASTLAICVR
jgi:hypothetical protein